MCKLIGMSFKREVKPRIIFKGFNHRGVESPDGWGLGIYPDETAQIFKESKEEKNSPLFETLKDYQGVLSKIIIAHVRLATKGKEKHKNTHPFSRELNGKEYLFAHNGTLKDYNLLETGRFNRVGETDSEQVFCHIMNSIEKRNISCWERKDFDWLSGILKNVNGYGSFNCILSDGKYVFCYHDKKGFNPLYFTNIISPHKKIKLRGTYWKINLPKDKSKMNEGFIVSTNKLTNDDWRKFEPRELIVLKDGRMVYSSNVSFIR